MIYKAIMTGQRSTVRNMSGYRRVSDCRSRSREFNPGPAPYFTGDWSWNNFYGHSPPFCWIIQEGLLSVTSESMCTKYWFKRLFKLAQEKVWLGELTVPPWPYLLTWDIKQQNIVIMTGPRSAVGNVSGNRWKSDCRSRDREFDPGPFPNFRGDWSWNNFYGHSPPICWIIQEVLLSVTSESMCTKYWLTTFSSLPRKKCG